MIVNVKNKIMLIDDEDYRLITNKCLQLNERHGSSYAYYRVGQKKVWIHKIVMGTRDQIDHINRNSLDNRKSNLRLCNVSENNRNRGKDVNKHFYSKYKGVYKLRDEFCSSIMFNRKVLFLGSYSTEEGAARVYDEAAMFLFKDFCFLNFSYDEEHIRYIQSLDIDYFIKKFPGKKCHKCKGYTFNSTRGTYRVRLTIKGERKLIGVYKTEKEASNAFDTAIQRYIPISNFWSYYKSKTES